MEKTQEWANAGLCRKCGSERQSHILYCDECMQAMRDKQEARWVDADHTRAIAENEKRANQKRVKCYQCGHICTGHDCPKCGAAWVPAFTL